MSSFNKVILLGNLTRDPEVRYTPNGKAIASFAIAVNKKYKHADGEIKESVSYVDIVVYGKSAENCGRYLHKGDPALIEGEIRQRRWDDKETGAKRSKIEVVAQTVTFMPKRERQGSGDRGQGADVPGPVGDAFPDAELVDDGEIPF